MIIGLVSLARGQTLERQVIGTTGAAVENTSAMLSYTVGEVSIQTAVTTSVILTQGFQQVDTTDLLGIPYLTDLYAHMLVYPNPTNGSLSIRIDGHINPDYGMLYLEVIDMNGKAVRTVPMDLPLVSLDVADLGNSAYLLTLSSEERGVVQRVRFIKY